MVRLALRSWAYSLGKAVAYARMAALRRPQTSASSLPLSKLWGMSSINDATRRRKPFPRRGGQLLQAEASGCVSLGCCMLCTLFATSECLYTSKCSRKELAI